MVTELNLYLEPSPSSALRLRVEEFLKDTAANVYPTTATKYNCHVSMTGFFQVRDGKTDVKDIIDTLDKSIERHRPAIRDSPAPQVSTSPVLVRKQQATVILNPRGTGETQVVDQMPVHLLLPVSTADVYRNVVQELAERYAVVRPKPINHVSLAYWDEPEASIEETADWHARVLQDRIMENLYDAAVNAFRDVEQPPRWDIVLYKRVACGRKIGQPHQFEEKRRWYIVDNTESRSI